ncbi:MAG: DNA/RNA non-specific endonuclease [Nibricoccus sp.]
MARKSSKSSPAKSQPRSFRRFFLVANLVVWGVIGGWYVCQTPARQAEVSRLVGNCFDSRKHVSAFDVAWDLWQLYYSKDYVAAVAEGKDGSFYGGQPQLVRTTATHGLRVLSNHGFTNGYSDELGNPVWTAYRVRDGKLEELPPRPEEFTTDARTVARVESNDYARSGYDRGHMAPNYAIALHYGREAQEETFRLSNICPQKHALNAGPWKELEQRIATNYPARFGEVWVLVGPIFGDRPVRLKRRIAVPEAFYMIIIDENEGRVRAEAFIFPQDTPAEIESGRYLTSIDEIERRTGLDFLNQLPAEAQNALEARVVSRVW